MAFAPIRESFEGVVKHLEHSTSANKKGTIATDPCEYPGTQAGILSKVLLRLVLPISIHHGFAFLDLAFVRFFRLLISADSLHEKLPLAPGGSGVRAWLKPSHH